MSIKKVDYFGFQGMDKNTDHKTYIAEIQHKYIQRSRCKGQREDRKGCKSSSNNQNTHTIFSHTETWVLSQHH